MKITWYGHSCFKITTNSTVIVTDPFSKDIGLKPPHCEADIVTVSHDHYDHNNISALRGTPFVINGPGKYEFKGKEIQGIESFHDNKKGEERGLNTIFTIKIEDIKICHLGDLGQEKLTNEQLEDLGEIDVLIIPIGGVYTIGGEEAVNIINQIEPKIVIPAHYKIPHLTIKLEGIETFLREIGAKKQVFDQLTIKKKDLPQTGMEIAVMKIV